MSYLRRLINNICPPSASRTNSWNSEHPRPTPAEHVSFWENDNLANIIPPVDTPAGFDEAHGLAEVCKLLNFKSVIEVGCGPGRLCDAFDSGIYFGIDINKHAITQARLQHPDYQFDTIAYDESYPKADLGLFYTVLLHVDDENVHTVAERCKDSFRSVLVAEILGSDRRSKPASVPSFPRDKEDYQKIFSEYILKYEVRRNYARYNRDISYLLFTKV